ncbi:MAG: NrfD/PsrC family molybdoenzyme membrane anchor subunit [Thermofilum sp.]|uniref:Molybdopterin oxidoreductase n=1 Tax=Thermofilum pendens TaxID=2269 RepID=A0A7C4H6E5_THEPE
MMFQEIWSPWLIGPFLWFAGIAGMGSVAYSLLRLFKIEEKLKELSLVIFASVVLGLVFVIADLSRPANMPAAILSSLAQGIFIAKLTESWMTLGITLLFLLLILSLLLTLRHAAVPALAKLTDAKWYLVLLALIGFLVTVYSGFLISSAPGIPFWNTALIPVLWVLSASICAIAVLKILVHSEHVSRFLTRAGLGLDIGELLALVALLNVPLYAGPEAARASAAALLVGPLAPAFWIGVVLVGVLAPMALGFLLMRKEDRKLGLAAASLYLVGALLLRVLVIQAGIFEPLHL